jgi:hypothetical protein
MAQDGKHIRHARNALNLLVAGAVHYLESDYGPEDDPDRRKPVDQLLIELHGELDDWGRDEEGDDAGHDSDIDRTKAVQLVDYLRQDCFSRFDKDSPQYALIAEVLTKFDLLP